MQLRLLVLAAAALAASTAWAQPDPVTPPVEVSGLWCGSGALHEFSLRLTQQDQDVQGELVRGDRVRSIHGTVEGRVLRTQATRVGALVLEHQGDELKVTGGDGPLVLARGQAFRRATAATCTG